LEVATRVAEQQRERHRALSLELEQARYEARLAARRYEAVDPLCVLRSYVISECEMLCWWFSSTVPGTHNYSDFRKAMRPAS
jgi:hypothetical protein